ncbi:MAG: hypothetical protein KAH99_02790 [Verrucomicrobia bacterium]|nr:hypothetical protein [Verrucomicrobiota bacterium]
MKTPFIILCLLATAAMLTLCGCASTDDYRDEKEYSDMPWNTPQQWEGSRSIPGMSPGQ